MRLWLGSEAACIGRGGVSIVSRETGASRERIAYGMKEVGRAERLPRGRIRRQGGGRKRSVEKDPTLQRDLDLLINPATCGGPESRLRWTSKSVRRLTNELNAVGHKTNRTTVAELLKEMGYSLQANKKTIEGTQHPDRDAQFRHINREVDKRLKANSPVISVDTKKKELVGRFKNVGRELRPKGDPEKVNGHDFVDKELGKVAPYGVYDQAKNTGWVSVGVDHDTAAFAVDTIRRWWNSMGKSTYPNANKLLITADCGGSNGYRVRLWKLELQKLADETGIEISVCHLPPGTSKWNKIEHRLFSFISQNWRGKPLVSREAIVNLIAGTTTRTGLKVQCELNENSYPKGIKVSPQELASINIMKDDFHGEWNYTIAPRSP